MEPDRVAWLIFSMELMFEKKFIMFDYLGSWVGFACIFLNILLLTFFGFGVYLAKSTKIYII